MVILSSQWKRKEYYQNQARDLRRQSVAAQSNGEPEEAQRLLDLALQAEEQAQGIEKQIQNSNR